MTHLFLSECIKYSMSIVLSAGQQQAYDNIRAWLCSAVGNEGSSGDSLLCTLCGNAGTGKTTLTRMIVKAARSSGKQVLCCAPTHKARKVMSNMINTCAIVNIPVITTASLLGIQKKHSYVGTRNYGQESSDKISNYDVIIIDEISMVSTADYTKIVELAHAYNKKVLFIGDDAQIPNPGQGYKMVKKRDGSTYLTKSVNPAFSLPNLERLSQIMRNSSDNPLLDIYGKIRDSIGKGISLTAMHEGSGPYVRVNADGDGYYIYQDSTSFLHAIEVGVSNFNCNQSKVITYTNQSVASYNRQIRSYLNYQERLVEGEIIMGYENIGDIENGQEYRISAIKPVYNYTISANGTDYHGLSGLELQLMPLPGVKGQPLLKIYTPDLEDDCNSEVISKLVELANKVNSWGSTKRDYVFYKGLKSQMFFLEPLYHYRGCNYAEREFKTAHPLLNRATIECISAARIMTELPHVGEIISLYPELLEGRRSDNKEIIATELLSDIYKVVDKDIDYGYAITAHKSQGSTYTTVFLDEANFNILRDGWSTKHNCPIDRVSERDRLKYVGVTRASKCVHIVGGS